MTLPPCVRIKGFDKYAKSELCPVCGTYQGTYIDGNGIQRFKYHAPLGGDGRVKCSGSFSVVVKGKTWKLS